MFTGLKNRILFFTSLILSSICFAGEDWQAQIIGPFSGLNNRDNSYAIPAQNAQDLLNVNITPGGKSVFKRKGYGLSSTLSVTTSPVHGIYSFFDSLGNDVSLFFNDSYLSSSVSGANPSTIFSNGPNGATYQCTDNLGYAYCANTSRTSLIKTDGSTSSSISGFVSTGTMVATCVTRLAMAGFLDRPSAIDFSADSDFTTWGTGSLGSSAVQLTISAPGSRITHIVYAFGRLMWFKDSSFGYVIIGNQPFQTDWVIRTVSFDVGTNDNTSVFREGILYFRGQDGHIYAFDGSNYQRLSREISGTISVSQSRLAGSWTQTTQSDWEAGSQSPSNSLNTTSSPGDLTINTTNQILTSSTQFQAGQFSFNGNEYIDDGYWDTTTATGSIQNKWPDSFSSLREGPSTPPSTSTTAGSWWRKLDDTGGCLATNSASGGIYTLTTLGCATTPSFAGIQFARAVPNITNGTTYYCRISTLTAGSSVYLGWTDTVSFSTGPHVNAYWLYFMSAFNSPQRVVLWGTPHSKNYKGDTINSSDITIDASQLPLDLTFWVGPSSWTLSIGTYTRSGSHTVPSVAGWFPMIGLQSVMTPAFNTFKATKFGILNSTYSTYTSPSFDTGVSTPIYGIFSATTSGNGAWNFYSQSSSDGVTWDSRISVSTGSAPTSSRKRYIRFQSEQYQTSYSGSPASLDSMGISIYSTGTFLSQIKNAPSLTSWDSFNSNQSNNGGTITYYIRSSTNNIQITSSTPSWTSILDGGIPTISTGTYFQIRVDFNTSSSTSTPVLNDFTQNWYEGSAADKSYATYFDDKIWWEVTAGTGATTNNKTLVYDLLNNTWVIYNLACNGFLIRQNRLYLGSAAGGYIYKFGDTENDNGSNICAYWKSKDFYGNNPFTTQEISNISVAAKTVSNSSMTVTYTLNGSTSTSFIFPLYSATNAFIGKNKNLPAGTIGNTYNIEYGNDATDQPFEVFGVQVGIRPKTWIPTP